MFDNIKNRIANLERETAQLKTELAEVKQNLSRVLGENHGLEKKTTG